MSAEPNQTTPGKEPDGDDGRRSPGKTMPPRPDDEPAEPSSPPCYLHELPPPHATDIPTEQKPASELTPEEQMERFEKELKESDWGHQPC